VTVLSPWRNVQSPERCHVSYTPSCHLVADFAEIAIAGLPSGRGRNTSPRAALAIAAMKIIAAHTLRAPSARRTDCAGTRFKLNDDLPMDEASLPRCTRRVDPPTESIPPRGRAAEYRSRGAGGSR